MLSSTSSLHSSADRLLRGRSCDYHATTMTKIATLLPWRLLRQWRLAGANALTASARESRG